MTDQDDLEAAVREALERSPTDSATENTVHCLLSKMDHDVPQPFLIRTLDQMVETGELELVGEKRGFRRYSLIESSYNGGKDDG